MKMSKLLRVMVITIAISCTSCSTEFKIVSGEYIQQRLQESGKHTAVSWWYLGTDEEYHFIVEKWPLERFGYRVSIADVTINNVTVEQNGVPMDEEHWENLKVSNFLFH